MSDQEKRSKYTYEELRKKYIDKEQQPPTKTKELTKAYNIFVVFIINMIVLISFGVIVGYYLDKKLKTTPIFMIILILLGIGGAFRNLIKSIFKKDEGRK